jgi:hypothetical protein
VVPPPYRRAQLWWLHADELFDRASCRIVPCLAVRGLSAEEEEEGTSAEPSASAYLALSPVPSPQEDKSRGLPDEDKIVALLIA